MRGTQHAVAFWRQRATSSSA